MVLFDANMILRYLLCDNREMAEQAARYLIECDVGVTTEVIAEVVYVLKRVYALDRAEIAEYIHSFLDLVNCRNHDVVDLAVQTYGSHNLDFVDCVLYAYHRVEGVQIATFDKQLLKLIDIQ